MKVVKNTKAKEVKEVTEVAENQPVINEQVAKEGQDSELKIMLSDVNSLMQVYSIILADDDRLKPITKYLVDILVRNNESLQQQPVK